MLFSAVGNQYAILAPDSFKNKSDISYLENLFGNNNLFYLTKDEKNIMNSNIFSISETVVVSDSRFERLNNWLRERNFVVEEINYFEISKMGGLFRCSTLPLIRALMRQITNHILMVKPTGFNYNAETAANNHFQYSNLNFSNKEISENAIREFDKMVELLDIKGVNAKVVDPIGNKYNPDAVFPNNWFSIHQNGTKVLYPMFAKAEEQKEIMKYFHL